MKNFRAIAIAILLFAVSSATAQNSGYTLASSVDQSVCNGRLTTESGVPVSTSDRTAQSTIYFTPFNGNHVGLYDGAAWTVYPFTELNLALSGLTSGKNYDVFIYNNAGTLTLELSAAWTNDTTRADAITLQDGVYVKSGATTRRFVGTIRTTGTTTTEDSGGGSTTQVGGKRFVWNQYNRVRRPISVIDKTDSWSYLTNSWRQADGATGNKVEFVSGIASQVSARANVTVTLNTNSASGAYVGLGLDSTTSPSGLVAVAYSTAPYTIYFHIFGQYSGQLAGYHYISWIEKGADNICNFLGDNGGDGTQSGLIAEIDD